MVCDPNSAVSVTRVVFMVDPGKSIRTYTVNVVGLTTCYKAIFLINIEKSGIWDRSDLQR